MWLPSIWNWNIIIIATRWREWRLIDSRRKCRHRREKKRKKNVQQKIACSSWANKLIYFSFRCWCWWWCCIGNNHNAVYSNAMRSITCWFSIIIIKSIDDAQLKYLFIECCVCVCVFLQPKWMPVEKETHLYMIEHGTEQVEMCKSVCCVVQTTYNQSYILHCIIYSVDQNKHFVFLWFEQNYFWFDLIKIK